MRYIDFSSVQGVLVTVLGLALFTLIGVGIRVLMMLTIQQRQQRMNRQINERLRTLIAAYKTLGGSFTGELAVDPTHLRELNQRAKEQGLEGAVPRSDRARRIRDAVEAALSDIILLGTEEQVQLASSAANEMATGRPIHTAELVVSLRTFIRKALDLTPIPDEVSIPRQGPSRQLAGKGKGDGERGGKGEGEGGGGGGMGGAMGGGGMGGGMGGGSLGSGHHADEDD